MEERRCRTRNLFLSLIIIQKQKNGGVMFKKLLILVTVFAGCAFLVNSSIAGVNQNLKNLQVDKQIVDDNAEAEMQAKIEANFGEISAAMTKHQGNVATGTLANGDTIGFTVRDFTMNTCMGRKIAIDPATGNIHTIYTQWEPTATDPYHEYYNFYDNSLSLWFGDVAIDPNINNVNTRSGRVINGPNGEAWISFHDHSAAPAHRGLLYNDASAGGYSFTRHEIAPGRFASADYKDGGATWFSTNDEDGDFEVDRFFYSTDAGVSWTQSANFLQVPAGDVVANVELLPSFNPSNGDIELMYANDNPGDVGEAAWWATSSDLGDNWNFTQIYQEETVLPGNVWYLIENFSQYVTLTDENNVTHFVFNGYGFKVKDMNADSTLFFIYPVVYWNTRDQLFVELTDSLHGRNPYLGGGVVNGITYGNPLADGRSGNAIGNAFPSLALGPNGTVAVIWEQAEVFDDSTLVQGTFPDGTPDAVAYATDIYGAFSGDGGVTWSGPTYLSGDSSKCERSPSMAEEISFDGSTYKIHYVYMYDPDPNQDLPNAPAYPAAWVYGEYDFTTLVGIDDEPNVAHDFKLSQNYPNPFNPVTNISFELKKSSQVTLEVFNTLGQKVATVLNDQMSAGPHAVKFDGSNLASGLYLYRLTTDNLTVSRKMMLLK
jgi:hypothetical protein